MAKEAFSAIVFDNKHKAGNNARGQRVKALFDAFIKDATAIGATTGFSSPTQEFYLKDFPNAEKKVNELLTELHDNLQTNIEEGNESAWAISNSKNDAMVQDLVARASAAGIDISEERQEQWMKRNTDALSAFQKRRTAGMNLSDRVWNLCDQTKTELEMALEIGLGDGKSAAALTKDVRQYLNEPNKLFRRVRDKATGKLRLSKAAAAYHSGRGVYRSSYKNALRMTATENNMAYRSADHERWNQMEFILGFEVHLSNNHTLNGAAFVDICDELAGKYPKEFKFVGWHPWCRCFVTSILPSLEDFKKYSLLPEREAASYDFGGKKIEKLPSCFNKWMLNPKNQLRIANAKNLPYFIKDNFVEGGWNAKSAQALRKGLTWVAAPKKLTPFDIAAARHAARPDGYAEKVMAMYNKTRDIDKLLAQAEQFSWNKDVDDWAHVLHDVRFSKTATLQQLEERERIVLENIEKAKDHAQKAAQGALNAAADFRSGGMVKLLAEDVEKNVKDGDFAAMHKNTLALAKNVKHAQTSLIADAQAAATDAKELLYSAKVTEAHDKLVAELTVIDKPHDFGLMRRMKDELSSTVKHQRQLTLQTSTNVYKAAEPYKSSTTIAKLQNKILKAQKANDYVQMDSLSRQLAKEVLAEKRAAEAAAKAKAAADAAAKAATETAKKDMMSLEEQFEILKDYQSYMKSNSLAYRYIEDIKRYLANRDAYPWMQQSFEETMEKLKNQKGFMKNVLADRGADWLKRTGIVATKVEEKLTLADCHSFEDVKKYYRQEGKPLPKTLQEYDDAVKQCKANGCLDPKLEQHRKEVEAWFKDLLDRSDYGMAINSCYLDNCADECFKNTFQTGTSMGYNGSSKTTGKIEEDHSRLVLGHKMFNPSQKSKIHGSRFTGKQFERSEYEKYGHLLDHDMTTANRKQEVWYGDVQVRFKKDKVCPTITFGDTLNHNGRAQPTLCCDPKIETFDRLTGDLKKNDFKDVVTLRNKGAEYIEMQYHGDVTIDCVESLVFKQNPLTIKNEYYRHFGSFTMTEEILDKYLQKGIDIYYYDSREKKVVLWKAGIKSLTKEEIAAVKQAASDIMDASATIESKDLSLADLRAKISKADWIGVKSETDRIARLRKTIDKRKDALRDLIPDIDDFHKDFTLDELEVAHGKIKSKYEFLEKRYGTDYKGALDKLTKERRYIEHPEEFEYGKGKTRPITWEVTARAYDRKMAEYSLEINKAELKDSITKLRTSITTAKGQKLIDEAEKLVNAGDIEKAKLKLAEAQKVKEKIVVKLGESSQITFDADAYSEARKNAAEWFKPEGTNPTMAARRAAFNKADEYMRHYASDIWNQLSQEEKEILWCYTEGSKYINEPLVGIHYTGRKAYTRDSLKDINKLTSIIEKAKPLEKDQWLEHSEGYNAFLGRFGIDLEHMTETQAKKLIGREAVNNNFLSTSCAKFSYFAEKMDGMDIVMNVYAPKGTKGVYTEPFAYWGDGETYGEMRTRYNEKGLKWKGGDRPEGESAGDQVEFVLQRGTKLKITKIEKKNGKWYVDVDITEQEAVEKLKKLP